MKGATSPLIWVDWVIIITFIAASVVVGIVLSRRGRRSVREYFNSGGNTPWWLLGTSMVATSFASDTPLTLSGWVVTKGIAQNWYWWCQVPVTMLGVFVFARLWQRTRLVTDTELVALRYSGRSAGTLRAFKALYLSLIYGCVIIGWVNLAMTRIIQLSLPDIPRVAYVDEALVWVYAHTPLSTEISENTRSELVGGDINPLQLYYHDWSLHKCDDRVSVVKEIELQLERYDYARRVLDAPDSGVDEDRQAVLSTFLREFAAGPLLAKLGITVASLPEKVRGDPALGLRFVQDVVLTVGGANKLKITLLLFAIVICYTVLSGLWGVLVTDFIQFWIAMAGAIALAVLAVRQVGGMDSLFQQMVAIYGQSKACGMTSITPLVDAGDLDLMPWRHFLVFVFFVWYVSGLTDGGSYFAQRMLSAKSERHASMGFLWYSVAHYCIRMWPWLIVGFVASVMFPYTRDLITGEYPGAAAAEGGYVRVMLAVLPSGLLGLVLASFFAAFMSTVSTQLNLGASYLLNDFYRPFLRKDAGERHYVLVSQIATVIMAAIGLLFSLFMNTISDAWFLIGTLSCGVGFVNILRWFWWRVNAWTELSCLSSLLLFVAVVKLFGNVAIGDQGRTLADFMPPYPVNLLVLVPYSVGIALVVTFVTKPVDSVRLREFYRRVQPGGPGWSSVEREIQREEPAFACDSPLSRRTLACWAYGSGAIYCFLFGIGKIVVGNGLVADVQTSGRAVGVFLVLGGCLLSWLAVNAAPVRSEDR